MKNIFLLLLPALLPSWNFFDIIAPSPRIQYTLLDSEEAQPAQWHEFRPRPASVSFVNTLKRLLWNSQWNESLFMMSCAERINEHYTQHSEDEILKRIMRELNLADDEAAKTSAKRIQKYLQFRLVFIEQHDNKLLQTVEFESRKEKIHTQAVL
jgi:hypothetical protein